MWSEAAGRGRHVLHRFRRAVGVEIETKYKLEETVLQNERQKTLSKRRKANEVNVFYSTPRIPQTR